MGAQAIGSATVIVSAKGAARWQAGHPWIYRTDIYDEPRDVAGIRAALQPDGILLRNDAAIRRHEGLPLEVVPVDGVVPDTIEVAEHGVRYLTAPRTGQKTGAFLDQRENRVLVAEATHPGGTRGAGGAGGGRALDAFAYHGSFALHLARRGAEGGAVDSSAEALERGRPHAALTGGANRPRGEANASARLRGLRRAGRGG